MGPFATATEFCEFTGMNFPADPARLQAILELSSALIRNTAGRTLSLVENDVVIIGGEDRTTLVLPNPPVINVDSLTINAVAFTDYTVSRSGLLQRTDAFWSDGATVTYDHGYLETEPQFILVKTICIEAAARAFTLNERSASEALGSTLMETAGYSPEVFLTPGERADLAGLDAVAVG